MVVFLIDTDVVHLKLDFMLEIFRSGFACPLGITYQLRGCISSSARLVSGCIFKPLKVGSFPRRSAEGVAGEEQFVVVDMTLHAHLVLKEENSIDDVLLLLPALLEHGLAEAVLEAVDTLVVLIVELVLGEGTAATKRHGSHGVFCHLALFLFRVPDLAEVFVRITRDDLPPGPR